MFLLQFLSEVGRETKIFTQVKVFIEIITQVENTINNVDNYMSKSKKYLIKRLLKLRDLERAR